MTRIPQQTSRTAHRHTCSARPPASRTFVSGIVRGLPGALICLFIFFSCTHQQERKHFAIWDFPHMHHVKKELKRGSSTYRDAYMKLVDEAGKAMLRGPFSVTFKNTVPPGGTTNDYMSMGPFWWPDPDQPGGLPYIRMEGVVNPDNQADNGQLNQMISDVRTLSLAWYFTGNREYARKAGDLVRTWFLNPETRMNPHLEYGQAIPGRTPGRGTGIRETLGFSTLTDAVLLLESGSALTHAEKKDLEEWFMAYFGWLTGSRQGKDADAHPGSHSVAYDVQVASIARFLGNDEYVTEKISALPAARTDRMIKTGGRQPGELVLNHAFVNSVASLGIFFDAGETGLKAGCDIFSHITPEGESLQTALEFLVRYAGNKEEWQWGDTGDWQEAENNLGLLVRRAARYFTNPEYQIMWEQAYAPQMNSHWSLLVIPGL